MKSQTRETKPQEIELKLSLPGANPAGLGTLLAQTPLLARRKAVKHSLYNIYWDTPDQQLRRQRVALRLRRVGSVASPQWLQTLKTGSSDESALSRRGEWEVEVPGAALDHNALKGTPWVEIDPSGKLMKGLQPCFVTSFERTTWLLRRKDGSVVEVALDIGKIEANGQQAPILELELELKAGLPGALFEVAREIARTLAVLPADQSKSERGYALAQGGQYQPRRAQPPKLAWHMPKLEVARRVLREMFAQFTTNLSALPSSDDPELVHQARVGWRRFRSALRLFRKIPEVAKAPDWHELQPLLSFLGELRNLEVAVTETLPSLASGFCRDDVLRAESWQAMLTALTQAAALQRKAVRYALLESGVGASFLAITEWLENMFVVVKSDPSEKHLLRQWATRRILRQHSLLKAAQNGASTLEQQHRVRILAKRLRYGVEALRDLLPKHLAEGCYQQAVGIQSQVGATRDLAQASVLVASLDLNPGIVEFLRGVVVGANHCLPAHENATVPIQDAKSSVP